MGKTENWERKVANNTNSIILQINEALAEAGLEEHSLKMGTVGTRSIVRNVIIELRKDSDWSVYARNYQRILIVVEDRSYKRNTRSMKINWVEGKPIVDKKKFIDKLKVQIELGNKEKKSAKK
jgi:hypothetical protein